jgi:hypothetical protein
VLLACLLSVCHGAEAADSAASRRWAWDAGPLIHTFPLTLEPGEGIEALGPLFYRREGEDSEVWGVPPLVSSARMLDGERKHIFVLPPVFAYHRYGEDWRWQFLQWFNGSSQDRIEDDLKRFNLFPIFFWQDSTDPEQDYWAVFPLHGTLKNRFFRDEAQFTLFPVWLKTRKNEVVTRNVLFPIFHLRDGPGIEGWQFWPLLGHERKAPGARTNLSDEVEVVPGHDKWFALWPVYFRNRLGIGTDNPTRVDAALPLYFLERSPKRDHTAVIWPLFSWSDDRENKFRQFNAPWPLIGFARGEGKRLDRVIPFYSVGRTTNVTAISYMWPIWKQRQLEMPDYSRDRRQVGIILYADERETYKASGQTARRIDAWPFFSWVRDTEGNERLHALSVLEPLKKGAAIRRNWEPLWSVWRSERDGDTGANSQSFAWNLYRRDEGPDVTKGSILFGLVQYQKTPAGRRWRWFYMGPRLEGPGAVATNPGDAP